MEASSAPWHAEQRNFPDLATAVHKLEKTPGRQEGDFCNFTEELGGVGGASLHRRFPSKDVYCAENDVVILPSPLCAYFAGSIVISCSCGCNKVFLYPLDQAGS